MSATTSPALRVLHVLRTMHPRGGGIQTYLTMLFRAMRGSTIAMSAASVMAGTPPEHVPPPVYAGVPRSGGLRNALRFLRWFRASVADYDLVHIHGLLYWQFVVAAMVCRSRGRPFVVTPHGSLLRLNTGDIGLLQWLVLKLFVRRWLSDARAVLVTTGTDAAKVLEWGAPLHVRTLTPSVDLPPSVAHRARSVRGDPLRVIFIGRIAPVKALPDLLTAIARVRTNGIEAHLDIVGEGSPAYLATLAGAARSLGIQDRVAFHGDQRGVAKLELLRRAHVLVQPSARENFGFAVAEALAQGVPVVVSAGVGLAELVRKEGCGLVVPAGDPSALADALAAFSAEVDLHRMSERACAAARQYFSDAALSGALTEIYRAATGR